MSWVRVNADTSDLRALAAALAGLPEALEAALEPVVEGHGRAVHEAAADNLRGRVLHVRSGRLLGSWQRVEAGGLTHRSQSLVPYGAVWERGRRGDRRAWAEPAQLGDVESFVADVGGTAAAAVDGALEGRA